MNLGYDIGGMLPGLRAQAESRFTETFTFFAATDGGLPDENGNPTQTETVLHSGVAGRVKYTGTQGQDVESGGQYPVVTKPEVHVAVGSVDVPVGVFVRVTGSSVDAGLVGSVFRISEPCTKGQVTAWRYPAEEVS